MCRRIGIPLTKIIRFFLECQFDRYAFMHNKRHGLF